jgi:hypothetical protein
MVRSRHVRVHGAAHRARRPHRRTPGYATTRAAADGSCAPASSAWFLPDEVEKAHPEVMNILLGCSMMAPTDSKGRTAVNFANTVVIYTSKLVHSTSRCGAP